MIIKATLADPALMAPDTRDEEFVPPWDENSLPDALWKYLPVGLVSWMMNSDDVIGRIVDIRYLPLTLTIEVDEKRAAALGIDDTGAFAFVPRQITAAVGGALPQAPSPYEPPVLARLDEVPIPLSREDLLERFRTTRILRTATDVGESFALAIDDVSLIPIF